jgi:hypothetical protein
MRPVPMSFVWRVRLGTVSTSWSMMYSGFS